MADTGNNLSRVQTARDIVSIFFLKKSVFIFTFIGVVVGALVLSFLTPPTYQSSALLLIKPQNSKPLEPARVDENTTNTVIFLLNSPEVLREVVVKHHLAKSGDERDVLKKIEDLRGRFSAQTQAPSSIIQLTYNAGGAQEAADQLNTLLDAYVRYHIRTYQSTQGRFEFFDDQTKRFRSLYRQVTNELASASRESNVLNPDLQKEKALSFIKDLELNKSRLREKLQMLRARSATIGSVLSRLKANAPETIHPSLPREAIQNYPTLVEMEKSLAQLLINRQRARSEFQEGTKPVIDADNEYLNMKMQIRHQMEQVTTDIGVEISSINNAINDIQAQINEVTRKNGKLSGDAVEFENLELEQRINRDNYLMYNAKKEEARINDEKNLAMFTNVRVASRPSLPVAPWFPQPVTIMLLSIPLAFILALAVSAASYALEKRVWTPTDVAAHTRLRYLGSLDAAEASPARRAARWPSRPLVPSRRLA